MATVLQREIRQRKRAGLPFVQAETTEWGLAAAHGC